jgi:hypothetical protein
MQPYSTHRVWETLEKVLVWILIWECGYVFHQSSCLSERSSGFYTLCVSLHIRWVPHQRLFLWEHQEYISSLHNRNQAWFLKLVSREQFSRTNTLWPTLGYVLLDNTRADCFTDRKQIHKAAEAVGSAPGTLPFIKTLGHNFYFHLCLQPVTHSLLLYFSNKNS